MKQKNQVLTEERKETELGLLPNDWNVSTLGKVADYNLGRTPPRKEKKYWTNGTFPWVSIADMRGNNLVVDTKERVSEEALKNCFKDRISKKGTLLMSFKLTIGRTALLGIDATHNEAIISIYPKKDLDKMFLFYYLPIVNYSKYMDRAIKGNTLNKSKIDKIVVPLPPLAQQQNIAYILSTVQTTQEKTERLVNSLKELKKSTMKHLFTYGAVSFEDKDKVKLKDTEIGKVPKEWEIDNLGNIFEVQQGKQLSSKESKEGKIKRPFLRTSNLLWGEINISKLDYMYFTEKELDKLKLKGEDILVCEGGDVGRTALWRGELEDCTYQNHIHRLRPKKQNYDPTFFILWMQYAILDKQMYIQTANRTTIPNISSSRLKEFVIPFPSLAEQQQIASILSSIDKKIEAEEQKQEALGQLFKSLLHNLMSGKIRVKNFKMQEVRE